jgi:putative transposase
MFHNSMFGDILKMVSRSEIKALITKHQGDRYRKSFKTWDHLVAMLAGQLSGASSLRDLEVTLNSHPFLHDHLGVTGVKRSPLSDANTTRNFQVFREIALSLLSRLDRSKRHSFEQVLTLLDSSPLRLSGRGHGWAKKTRDSNAGLNLHVQYDHASACIEYVAVEDATLNDVTIAQQLALEAHRIYVFDKGYCDYNWWKAIADKGSHFVTRLKKNAAYTLLHTYPIAEEDKGFILKDCLITLSNKRPRGGKKNDLAGIPLRLIEIRHPSNTEKAFYIVTNAVEASASSIAGWYKERWSIELLFKWLKQNLKIRRFLGESRNAIMIQIFVAIIAYALLKLYRIAAHLMTLRLKDVGVLVKANLFTRPKLFVRIREKRQNPSQTNPQLAWEF